VDAGLAGERERGERAQHEEHRLPAHHVQPGERGRHEVAAQAEGSPRHDHRRRARTRSGNAAEADGDVEQVAQHDRGDSRPEAQAEAHERGSDDDVGEADVPTEPHPEQVAGVAAALVVRDGVDAVLLDAPALVAGVLRLARCSRPCGTRNRRELWSTHALSPRCTP